MDNEQIKKFIESSRKSGIKDDAITSFLQQKGVNLGQSTPEPQQDFLSKASNVVSSIFPGKKIGEAIGTQIAKAMATPEEKQFISPAPSATEIAGDALQIGAFFLPVGKVAKGLAVGGKALGLGRAAQTAGNITAGGLAGYTFDVGLGLAEGEEKPFQPGIGTAIGAGIPGAGAVARGGARLAGEVAGKTTGAGFSAIKQGLEATTIGGDKGKAFTSALRGGTTPESIVEEAKRGLQTIKQTRTQEYVKQLEVISKNKTSLDISPVVEEVGTQLDKFGVEVTEQGLDFSRSTLRFNKAAQDDITTIVNEMKGFGLKEGDRTAIGIDSLKRAFDDLYTPSGEARAFVASVKSKARAVLSQVDGYDELSKNYGEKSDIVNNILKGLSLGDKVSVETAFKKLTSSLRTNNEFRQQFIQELDQATGGELLSKIAGQQLSELMPRGLQGVLAGTGGAIGLSTGVGVVPLISAALTTSPRIVGEIVSALGFTGNKLNKVIQLIEKNGGKLQFPGDAILDKAKATPNKQGGFLKIPQSKEALEAKAITSTKSIKKVIPSNPTTPPNFNKGVIPNQLSAKEAIAKGLTEEQYVKGQQKGILYHGSSSDLGDSPTLKRGYGFGDPGKYTGQDFGGIFFTPSEKYARQYAGSVGDKALYSYKLSGKEQIFDISDPKAVQQFIDNAKNWTDYSSPKVATDAAKRIIKNIEETSQHGAADWATVAGFETELEMSGFHGVRLLERAGENITQLANGSFKVTGKPVYSYGLFKGDIPVQRAKTTSQLRAEYQAAKKANK